MLERRAINLQVKRALERLDDSARAAWYSVFMPFWRVSAMRRRNELCRTYIAISGSCGKSSATMIAGALFGAQAAAHCGYFTNNMRYVFRHMRKLDRPVDFFVQEVSEFPKGITAETGRSMRPDAVMVTAVGLDHVTVFRKREEVAREIALLVQALGPNGVACLNADDPHVRNMAAQCSGRVVLYGRAADAELRAENVDASLPGGLRFDLVAGGRRRHVTTRFVGTLLLPSILGSLALIHALGLDLDRAVADLAAVEPLETRMRVTAIEGGHTYVLDTRKAPLWSTRLLIDDLANMSAGRRILVLGDLSDAGSDSSKKYRQVVRAAAKTCDLVIGIGRMAGAAERVRHGEGLENVVSARNFAEVAGLLETEAPALVVVKGSKMLNHLSQLRPSSTPAAPVA